MSLWLPWDEDRELVYETVARFCGERCDPTWVRENGGAFDRPRWEELAALGVLGLGSAEGEAGLREAMAASEALGEAVFPGPLVEAAVAGPVLAAGDRERLASGEAIAGMGAGSLFSFAPEATWLISITEEGVSEAEPRSAVEPVATLGGETWGHVDVELGEASLHAEAALQQGRLWAAGLLVGLAAGQLQAAAEHAKVRRQFGRRIGEFQAVSHPLSDGWTGLQRTTLLVREAAASGDRLDEEAETLAAAAWLSARRMALELAHMAHQVFGAVGITHEGPAFAATRRIRQLASLPLGHGAAERVRERTLTQGAGLVESHS